MVRKLLLVALTTVSYASALTIESSDNAINTSYSQNEFIDLGSPNFRLGDYEVTDLVNISAGGGEVRYHRIEVIIPHSVFDDLSNYDIVYISIPNYIYSYNSTVSLNMGINLYDSQGYFDYAISGYPNILLNEFMLAKTGFTVIDNPPYYYNLFDPNFWDYNHLNYEIRLLFTVPYTAYAPSPANWQEALRDITLFTKLGSYSNGYSDGYSDGVQEGITQAEGTWLGNLIFGTVGSVVGFIFAISDFEVLGVSIMSIITLFVAIGVIMLFIKLIKGTN